MTKVYVVEDDESLRRELCALLELEGLECVVCEDFSHAAEEIAGLSPGCAIIDAGLPGIDGRVIARKVRERSQVPLIMLTCLDSEFDEVMAMNSGIDDFLTKPYRPAVLIAHIHAALRRAGNAERRNLEYKGVVLDAETGRVSYGGSSTELSRNEARILGMLIRGAGHVISRSELMCELWDSDAFVDDNTLTVNINRVRRALASLGVPDGFITTRRGEGYVV